MFAEGLGALLAVALFVVFIALEIGGISFRKDCVTPQGTVTHDWTFQWYAPIPYVFRPSAPGCAVHTGTRVALNEIGLFPYNENPGRILLKSGAATQSNGTAYYDGLYAVIVDIVNQVKAGGFLKAPPDFMSREQAAIEQLSPPSHFAEQQAKILHDWLEVEAEFRSAKAASARGDKKTLNALGLKSSAQLQDITRVGETVRSELSVHPSP